MALQMATNILPDSFAGVGGAVFDAKEGLSVSWQVNGESPLVAYQIDIYLNNEASTKVYSTNKISLAKPFYGVNYAGKSQRFSADIIAPGALTAAGISNGNTYKMVITQWWSASDKVIQSSAAVIKALSKPTIQITTFPEQIEEKQYSFTAEYLQPENVSLNWVRWQLRSDSTEKILFDTGNIYGTSELRFDFDGFFSGDFYAIKIDIQDQEGQNATSGWVQFSVLYSTDSPDGKITAEQKCGWNGVNVSWSSAKNIDGAANGPYAIENGQLNLPANSSVDWNEKNGEPISFSPPYAIAWKGKIDSAFSGKSVFSSFLTKKGLLSMSISSSLTEEKAEILLDGKQISSITFAVTKTGKAVEYVDFSAVLTSTDFYVRRNTEYKNTAISYVQPVLERASLMGDQICDYFWVESGTLSNEIINQIIQSGTYKPEAGENSYFLADFTDGLNAGNIIATGYAIYRRDITNGEYVKLASLPADAITIVDYSAVNGHEYEYQLWYQTSKTYAKAPVTSNVIKPCRWNDIILACTEDEDGTYHAQKVFSFSCNIETGESTNNNSPDIQKTFTRYPSVQPDSSLYISGVLTSYIGSFDKRKNTYMDTAENAQELMELNITPYILFLRDRKGNLRRISVNGSITQKIEDDWHNQAVKWSFPWVEVDDGRNAKIILTSADAAYPVDQIEKTTVFIDPETGILSWETPNPYEKGSFLETDDLGYLYQETKSSEITPAQMEIIEKTQNLIVSD